MSPAIFIRVRGELTVHSDNLIQGTEMRIVSLLGVAACAGVMIAHAHAADLATGLADDLPTDLAFGFAAFFGSDRTEAVLAR